MDLERLASIFDAVRVVQLRQGDFLVFRSSAPLDVQQMAEVHARLEELIGHGRILILDNGADLAILRPGGEPEAAANDVVDLLPNGQPKRGKAPGAIS